ncbi:PREDICTED: uncharacterized protein LOC106316470 isoform X1 [Brassica oleracea var. oleracea]|uniref:uncharacterized protein LOC106316470 isoform X1 n=1 Tax=Brassica oleracea var. oleracea TaxID=109376 RepID=UPI0006A710A3|nr:PREDICTED: uncharacterized protein LOC106316470 isoform X1 [Brassica oleracea var. oleracea]
MSLILSVFFFCSCYRKLVRKKVVIDKAKNTRGMTLPKLCPSVCKVVVVTREQELVLCRGDVTNLSPSRLTRMLQSLLECQVQPLKLKHCSIRQTLRQSCLSMGVEISYLVLIGSSLKYGCMSSNHCIYQHLFCVLFRYCGSLRKVEETDEP